MSANTAKPGPRKAPQEVTQRVGSQRVGAPRTLGAMLPKVTRRLAQRRGFAEADLIAHWPSIVGPEIGRRSQPERLRFPNRKERLDGTLTLRVDGAWAVELMHMEPQVLERINGFFGYPAVARLKVRQAPVHYDEPDPPPVEAPLDTVTEARLQARVSGVANGDVREKLLRLGQALARRGAKGP
jgi:hypothetical protein